MASPSKVLNSSSFRAHGWRGRWALLRDVLGGGLVLAAWLALWTVTWAAVAGPIRDGGPVERPSVVSRSVS
jgi:hypothetical protein